jgi:hypothetical protein
MISEDLRKSQRLQMKLLQLPGLGLYNIEPDDVTNLNSHSQPLTNKLEDLAAKFTQTAAARIRSASFMVYRNP